MYRPPDYFLDFFTVAKEMYVNCYCDDTTDCWCECHWKGPNANWFSGLRDDWWDHGVQGESVESKYYLLQLKEGERLSDKSLVRGEVEAEAKKLCYYKDEFKVSNDDYMKYRISLHVDEEINNYQQAYKEATDKYVKSEPIAGKKRKKRDWDIAIGLVKSRFKQIILKYNVLATWKEAAEQLNINDEDRLKYRNWQGGRMYEMLTGYIN